MPKKGGKLKAKEVKDFLNASYDKTPPNDLDGYILDKSLSTATAKVYYNPQTNHAVVAHRGTQGAADWGNNLAYAVGAYNLTNRYKQGKKTQDQAEKKYGKQNISTLGHSQGAILARKLGTDTKEVINVNPAYTNERPAKNEYNIRSSTDVVSGLYAPVAKTREILFPKYSEKHDITIPSQSATDVLGEHSYDILDRIGEKEIGVGAGNKISSNSIMKAGKRYSRLGYTGEDIDWIGGGVGGGAGVSIMLDKMNPQNRGVVFFNDGQLVAPPEYYSGSDVSDESLPSTFDLSESDIPDTFELSDEEPTGGSRRFPTNNNNGAVGTPYVNRGTNPFGTRGAGFHDGHSSVDKYFKAPKGLRRGAGKMRGGATPTDIRHYISFIRRYSLPIELRNIINDIEEQLDNAHHNPEALETANELYEELMEQARPFVRPDVEDIESGDEKEGGAVDKQLAKRSPNPTIPIPDPSRREAMERHLHFLSQRPQTTAVNNLIGLAFENLNLNEEDDAFEIYDEILDHLGITGGKLSLKSIQKGIAKATTPGRGFSKAMNVINPASFIPQSAQKDFGNAINAVNPMYYALKDKNTSEAMGQSGQITHDYLLPAVVSAGKPIYDATAITASTMLTGNPVLGKVAADTLWNEMVAKQGADPRQNQKSAELGELSSTFGQAVSKPYSIALGGMGRANRFRLKAGMEGRRKLKGGANNEEDPITRANRVGRLLDEHFTHLQARIQQQVEFGLYDDANVAGVNRLGSNLRGLRTRFRNSNSIAEQDRLIDEMNNVSDGLSDFINEAGERLRMSDNDELTQQHVRARRRMRGMLRRGEPVREDTFVPPENKPKRGQGRRKMSKK